MEKYISYKVVLVVAVTTCVSVSCASASESNGTAAGDINGKFLIKLGRQLKKPMLTLLGMAVSNLQNHHLCDDWTQWSECSAIRVGYISTRKRSRKCARKLNPVSTDLENENKTPETGIDICEGKCPRDYNVTKNGFCTKLYVNAKVFGDALKQCQKDGGQLIDIDSELKYEDVKTARFPNYIFIDGRRKDATSPWLLEDGSQKQFFKWATGEPDKFLCMIMHPSNGYWYDSPCTTARPFLCEITTYLK